MFAKISIIACTLSILVLSSCGTIVHGTKQTVPVMTNPPGATVFINGRSWGHTPTQVTVSRKTDHILTITKPGYLDETVFLRSSLSGTMVGNVFTPVPIIGMGVDVVSGGAYSISPEDVQVNLRSVNGCYIIEQQ